ncbi:MAG: ABC transporter substrate-binding protein, partial [Burkholderiales bacterium]
MKLKPIACASLVACGLIAGTALAQDKPLKIGFVTDMSGLYADLDGEGGAEAIRMAIADFGGKVLNRNIELVTADHQNKADIAASRVRQWIDEGGVSAIIGGTSSGTAIASAKIAQE